VPFAYIFACLKAAMLDKKAKAFEAFGRTSKTTRRTEHNI